MVFDLSEPATFVSVKKWLQEIANHCDEVPRVLVGNKLDAPNRVVEKAGKWSLFGLFSTTQAQIIPNLLIPLDAAVIKLSFGA